jgi:hypothetical protein
MPADIQIDPLVHGNLKEEIVSHCELAIKKIKELRESFDRPLVPAELFEMSEFLHSFRAYLTSHILLAEAQYRDRAEEFYTELRKVNAADTRAKTTPEYRAWKYLSRVDMLAEEQVLLVKKVFDRMGNEFRSY